MVSMSQRECKAQGMSDAGLEKLKANMIQIQKVRLKPFFFYIAGLIFVAIGHSSYDVGRSLLQ